MPRSRCSGSTAGSPTSPSSASRRASAVGVVCVSWQQVCLGVAAAGRPIDVWVTEKVLQFYDGDQLLRTLFDHVLGLLGIG